MNVPKFIEVMEPISAQKVPADSQFIHSVKWDGVRQIVYCLDDGIRIHNRNHNDRTVTFPELHQVQACINKKNVVFDGEVVALHNGLPSFSKVMKRDFVRSWESAIKLKNRIPITYMVFDILYCDGVNVMGKGLKERLEILHELVIEQTEFFQIVGHIEDGQALLETTKQLGLEGIISKDRNSPYRPGIKNREWQKIKHFKDMNVAVGGYTVKNQLINSLSVGAYDKEGKHFYYLGNVATGLSFNEIRLLTEQLTQQTIQTSPFSNYTKAPRNQFWVMPRLTLKVSFLEFTDEYRLRHPTIEGFLMIPAIECIIE